MEIILRSISIITLLLSTFFIVRGNRTVRIYEKVMLFFLFSTAQIILIAFMLSAFNLLSYIQYWALANTVFLAAVFVVIIVNKESRLLRIGKIEIPRLDSMINYFQQLSFAEKILIIPALVSVIYLACVNLLLVIFFPPQHWDSFTYHLPRVAYYLQHGNLEFFEANYWAQVVHLKNSAILLLYTFLASGRYENFFRLVQFLAYVTSLFTVYGISRRIGLEKSWALLSSLCFGLFIEVLMEAVTPQNDLLITVYVGIVVYFLLLFKEDRDIRSLFFAILSMGIGMGIKASFITIIPSIFLIALLLKADKSLFTLNKGIGTILVIILVIGMFVLPSGYLENYKLFNNPLGPKDVLEHSFDGKSATYVLKNGSLNILRFGLEFMTLDGLPPHKPILELQLLLKKIPVKVMTLLNIPIGSQEATWVEYGYFKMPVSNEDYSNLGILGFAILWPMVFLLLFNFVRNPTGRVLALGWVVFIGVQAFSGPYDPFRGRYFIYAAVFASPLIGCFIKEFINKKPMKMYLYVILLLGCISAVSAVQIRHSAFLKFPVNPERLELMWYNKEVFKKYEAIVPTDAIVAVCFRGDSFEYQLFGKGLTRTIIPVNSFTGKISQTPSNADYLIYQKEFLNYISEEDTHLGDDYYLKKLK